MMTYCREREGRGNLLHHFFLPCVSKTTRGRTGSRRAQSRETQIRLKTGSGSGTKADETPSQGVASSVSEVQPGPEDLTV